MGGPGGGDDGASGKFVRTDIPRLMKEVADQLCEVTGGTARLHRPEHG